MKTLSALAFALALWPSVVAAQQFPVIGDHSVIGRIGIVGQTGPSQAIPFSTFLPNLVGTKSPNIVFAGPGTAPNALPTFRPLIGADLPNPSASTLGGIQSVSSLAHNWIAFIDTSGVPHQSQPACADLSNAAASCSTDTTNATNIASGTLNTARLPAPFTSGTASGNTSKFVTTTGTLTNGHCASYDSNGNAIDSGATCGASAMALLNTLTASNSATLSDTTSLTATYSSYEIVFLDLVPATNSVSCLIQVHSGGTFQATSYLANEMHFTGGSVATVAQTTNIPCSSSTGSNVVPGFSGMFRIYNPSLTTTPKNWTGSFSYTTGAANIGGSISGFWNANGAVDGFQVLMSAGNITSGTIKIYGIQ